MPDNGTNLSIQPRFEDKTASDTTWLWTLWEALQLTDGIPAWGTPGRIDRLREFARAEPILAGAVASMQSKALSLDWQITGGRNRVRRFQQILAEAEDGAGWSFFLDRLLSDYLTADLGGVMELGRDGPTGPVAAIYNLDAGCLKLTGLRDKPLIYTPRLASGQLSGRAIPLTPLDFARVVDLPSANEHYAGLGFCAVSRALKAARILLALYNYEEERLSDLPLPGIVAVTGMTQGEVKKAFDLYEALREGKQQSTFKGLLWLAAQSSPINPIQVDFTPFSGVPESFDREQVLTHYVYTLALDFGVDVREFWPASQAGATKAEAEIQHQKAKGKGFGRMLATVERAINWDVLPEGLEFIFDQRDSEDDLVRERIREVAIANVRRAWEPAMSTGEGIISTEEARRLLVELDALPDWIMGDLEDATVYGDANVSKAASQRIAEKASQAGLQPGEDLVSINGKGDMITLWSSRYYSIAAPGWPTPAAQEVAAGDPFQGSNTLTAEYHPSW